MNNRFFRVAVGAFAVAVLAFGSRGAFAAEPDGTVVIDNEVTTGHFRQLSDALDYIATKPWQTAAVKINMNIVQTNRCVVPPGKDVRFLNTWNNERRIVTFATANLTNDVCFIDVAAGAKLTIGGEECHAPLVFRGAPDADTDNGSKSRSTTSQTNTVLVLVEGEGSQLTLDRFGEIAYGRNVVWVRGGKFVQNAGVVHSGWDMMVNVESGEFEMNGGYIMHHYASGSLSEYYKAGNTVMDISAFSDKLDKDWTYGGGKYYHLKKTSITEALKGACTPSASAWEWHYAVGVHLHWGTRMTMNGGNICGFLCSGDSASVSPANGITVDATTGARKMQFNKIYYNSSNNQSNSIDPGVVDVDGATFIMNGGSIYGNYRQPRGGVAVFVSNRRLKTEDYVDGVYTNALFEMNGGRIAFNQQNSQTAGGGAIRFEAGSTMRFLGGSMDHNVCAGGGGAIRYVSARFEMGGTARMEWNRGVSDVGSNPRKDYCGGAIAAVNQPSTHGSVRTEMEILGGLIANNLADFNGGAIVISDKSNNNAKPLVCTLSGVVISNNLSLASGGAMYVAGNGQVIVSNGTDICFNQAKGSDGQGGAIYLDRGGNNVPCSLTTYDCTIRSNKTVKGGAVALVRGNYESRTSAAGETVMTGNSVTRFGGGLFAVGDADGRNTVKLGGGTFSGNNAYEGGAIFVTNITFTADGGRISGNTATVGGGLRLAAHSNATFDGTVSFTDNQAEMGGAVYLDGGADLTVNRGTLVNNRAVYNPQSTAYTDAYYAAGALRSGFGGALYLGAGSDADMTEFHCAETADISIYDNTADRGGDDIVADGEGTKLSLPDRDTLKTDDSGFAFYWYEDYNPADAYYPNVTGTDNAVPERLRPAMAERRTTVCVPRLTAMQEKTYLCLAVGYGFEAPTGLWITDCADAGDGRVYLQFEPQFDSIVPVEAWARKLAAKDGFYALWADSKSDLDKVLLTDVQHAAKVSLREYDPVDAATGRVWVELTVPDGTEGPSVGATGRLWRLAIVEETADPQP